MVSPTVNATRFLLISNTHNLMFSDCDKDFWHPMPKVDVLLHCGDLTHCGGVSSYKKALKLLGAFDAELKIVIAGNHDLDLDEEYWKTHLGDGDDEEDHDRALATMTGSLAATAGVTYLEEGTHTFTLQNGATFTVYTSPYSPDFCDWAFPYKRDEDRYNGAQDTPDGVKSFAKNPIPDNVDIIMTHGPPEGILDSCPGGNVGCPNLLRAVQRVRPLMHCFGHIHEGNGAELHEWASTGDQKLDVLTRPNSRFNNTYPKYIDCRVDRGKQTLMINAAIMDVKNQPLNKPWVVDLNLSMDQ